MAEKRGAALLAVWLAACGGAPATAPEVLTGPDGHPRLGRDVVPLRYALDLSIDPTQTRFRGQAEIALTLFAPTDTVRMHGEGLRFERVAARVGPRSVSGRAEPGPNGGLALAFAETLPAGGVTLDLAWDAVLPEVPIGLYRVEERGDWYAFTQFEPLEARKVFPGFDQPEFKTPYRVTLRVPAASVALSNAPEAQRRVEGDTATVTFAETKPLPTYLVAFAVGPFDLVEAPAGATPIPLRVVTPRGRGALAAFALERTPPLLAALTDWFDSPYPYEKLDLVAVPNFGAGAMENAGLITFRDSRLLIEPAQADTADGLSSQLTLAHELAHMWFGDLVTPAWWDDLWLNEAFATWMAGHIVHQVRPELEIDVGATGYKTSVMGLDSAKHARAVRQPISHGGDVYNAFDGITYGKGSALLHMFERWMGPRAFRRGLQSYLGGHVHGVATTAELLGALDRASGKPVTETIARFLDQPGTPLVRTTMTCVPGASPRLSLAQSRALPLGSDAPVGEPWRVPVCVRYAAPSGPARECFLLEAATQDFPLATTECPAWLHPNADEDGYYRWSLPADSLRALVTTHRAALTPRERVGLPGHLGALFEAGELDVGVYLDLVTALAADEQRQVLTGVLEALGGLRRLVPEAKRPAFAARVRALLAPHLTRIGAEPVAGEPPGASLLRPDLVSTLTDVGEDEPLRARAREVALRFAADPASVPAPIADTWLHLGARMADAALWDQLRAAVRTAPTPDLRGAAVQALGAVTDPTLLAKSYDLMLDGTLRAQDWRTLHRARADVPAVREALWSWLTTRHDDLVTALGPESAARYPALATGFCAPDDRARVAAFFSDPARARPGTERNLGLALESIDRCVRLRERAAEALGARL